jgi:hypothetical protein
MYGALMTSLFAVAEFGKHDSVQPESCGNNHLGGTNPFLRPLKRSSSAEFSEFT